ncbi:capsid protein VP3 [Betapolyomavirus secumuris]|nr:capsid protein VP3 [Betapolyomavirus secumuris]AAA46555.2 capsid protein VP3 [Betapolyomavirus secumuris]
MALQIWYPDLDILFPGALPFARFVNYIDPANWAADLYRAVGRYFWERVQAAGINFIEQQMETGRELAMRSVTSLSETLSQYFENARWAVSGLFNFFVSWTRKLLFPVRPVSNSTETISKNLGHPQPYSIDLYDAPQLKGQVSATYVTKVDPPGGANQRSAPDWMLPLLLGLYGDLTPSWKDTLEELEAEEDGSHSQKANVAKPRPKPSEVPKLSSCWRNPSA